MSAKLTCTMCAHAAVGLCTDPHLMENESNESNELTAPEYSMRRRFIAAIVVLGVIGGLCYFPLREADKRHERDRQFMATAEVAAAYDKGFWAGTQAALDDVARSKEAAGDTNIIDLVFGNLVNNWASNTPSASLKAPNAPHVQLAPKKAEDPVP